MAQDFFEAEASGWVEWALRIALAGKIMLFGRVIQPWRTRVPRHA
jgi:hypothetical protein